MVTNAGSETRNLGVSIAKGLTIILMVLGHTSSFPIINDFLLLMRMPLFFVMSGYCFKTKYLTDGSKYLSRRVTGIYWPYVKWSLVFLILHNFFFKIHFYEPGMMVGEASIVPYGWTEMLLHGGAIVVAMQGHDTLLGGYWFLHDLFFGSLLFYVGLKVLKNRYVSALVWLLLATVLAYTGWYVKYVGINSHLFLAAFFITVGHCYRLGEWKWAGKWWYIVSSVVTVFCVSLFWHSDMVSYRGWEVFAYSACAIAGALMLFGVGEKIAQHSGKIVDFLCFTGGKTFNVLTWHFVALKLVSMAIILIYGLPIERLASFPAIKEFSRTFWWVVYFCVGVGVPLLWSYYYDKVKLKWFDKKVLKSVVVGVLSSTLAAGSVGVGVLSMTLVSCSSDDEEVTYDGPYPYYRNNAYPPTGGDTLKILSIGNSFTDDATAYLGELVKGAGIDSRKCCVYTATQSGASLRDWVDNYKFNKVVNLKRVVGDYEMEVSSGTLAQLLAQDWTVVTIQQVSSSSGNYSTIFPYSHQLIDEILSTCTNPGVTIGFNMSWSYASFYEHSKRWGEEYWRDVAATARSVVEKDGIDLMIPTGTAIQNARNTSLMDASELTRDGIHLSFGVGRYIAACTWFQMLFAPMYGVSVVGNSATHRFSDYERRNPGHSTTEVTDSNRILAQRCAYNATLYPYSITVP